MDPRRAGSAPAAGEAPSGFPSKADTTRPATTSTSSAAPATVAGRDQGSEGAGSARRGSRGAIAPQPAVPGRFPGHAKGQDEPNRREDPVGVPVGQRLFQPAGRRAALI